MSTTTFPIITWPGRTFTIEHRDVSAPDEDTNSHLEAVETEIVCDGCDAAHRFTTFGDEPDLDRAEAWQTAHDCQCERCNGTGLVSYTIVTQTGHIDADDQPCPDCT